MISNITKHKNYLSILKVLTLTTIFTLLIIFIFLLSTKISELNNKKNNLLKYSTEAYININDLHNNIVNRNHQINFDTIKKLKKALSNAIANIKKYNNQSIFFYNNNSANIVNNIEFLWKDTLFDVNSLLDNQEKIYTLFNVLQQLHVLLLQTKVDCKALIEEMLVININANKISLAQQTIWLVERVTNSIESYIQDMNYVKSNDNFINDIKNLFNIISSLKNGNSLINTTKIEDRNIINYLSKIDINLQKTTVLFKTIEDKLITFAHVKAISESIEQSTIKFNEYLISLNNVTIDNEAYSNIFLFMYASLLLLIILTLFITIFVVKQYYYNKYSPQTANANYNNFYVLKLVADIESLSLVNLSLKTTTTNKEFTPLIVAINKYTNYIAQHLNKIYNDINYIAKLNIHIDKYKSLKVNCLSNILTKATKQTNEIEYLVNKHNKIIDTSKDYTAKITELMLLIDKLPTMVKMLNTNDLLPANNVIKKLITSIKSNNELTNEVCDRLEVFMLNYELQGYNFDNNTNKITEIQDKLKKLRQQQELVSATLADINIEKNAKSVISKLMLILNDLLVANKKLLQPHKLITSQLATINKQDTNNNEIILNNIELIDKAFSKLISDKQQIKITIDNLEEFKKNTVADEEYAPI